MPSAPGASSGAAPDAKSRSSEGNADPANRRDVSLLDPAPDGRACPDTCHGAPASVGRVLGQTVTLLGDKQRHAASSLPAPALSPPSKRRSSRLMLRSGL